MKPIKIYNDSNRLTIDWTLNTLCTYHCSYCPPMLHRGTNIFKDKDKDKEIVLNFLNKLKAQAGDRGVHIFINGGEPTISPVFETLIDFINDAGWYAYVNTNGSRSLDWWEQYAHKIFKVTVSYHPETVIDEEIFDKVAYIGTQTNVGVFTLMYPPLWDKSLNAYHKFAAMDNVTLGASRVFKRDSLQADSSYEYDTEQLAWLEKHSNVVFKGGVKSFAQDKQYGNTFAIYEDDSTNPVDEVDFVNNRKNNFIGWNCRMGADHLFINSNWLIRQAACSHAGFMGTIEDFTGLNTTSTVCKDQWCMCTADVLITKEAP
jgi:organic radical activating enzyme